MLIVYYSRTGNVQRFIDKLELRAVPITEVGESIDEPYVLLSFTDRFGEVPKKIDEFLSKHHKNLIGVASSGNRNWGSHLFGKMADTVSQRYDVPIIHKFEMSGIQGDVKIFKERVLNLYDEMD